MSRRAQRELSQVFFVATCRTAAGRYKTIRLLGRRSTKHSQLELRTTRWLRKHRHSQYHEVGGGTTFSMLFVRRKIKQHALQWHGNTAVADPHTRTQIALDRTAMTLQLTAVEATIAMVVDAAQGAHGQRNHQIATCIDEIERALLVLHEMRRRRQRSHQAQQRNQAAPTARHDEITRQSMSNRVCSARRKGRSA